MTRFVGRDPRVTSLLVALLLAAAVTSCAKKQETTENTTTTETTTPDTSSSTMAAPALSDANIAAIVVAANDVDIKAGQMAKSTSKNTQVKTFAEQMITDHTSVNKQATDLAHRISLSPEDNDASNQLKANGDAMRDTLKAYKGADFDRAYINNEVAYHEAVLSMLDNTLIPGAQNADLKSLLQNVRPAIAAHLEHAKQVQQAVTK